MAKQKKHKKHIKQKRNPPVSALDRLIHILIATVAIAIVLGIYLAVGKVIDNISFADSSVIAFASRGTLFFLLPLFLYIIVSVGISFMAITARPFFRNKKVNYNDAKWNKVYPILDKTRPAPPKKPEEKKAAEISLLCWIAGLILVLILFSLSLCGRYSLKENFKIEKYSVFNKLTQTYSPEEYENVEFSLYYKTGSKHGTRSFVLSASVTLPDGKTVDFNSIKFKSDDMGEIIRQMLELERLMPEEKVTYFINRGIDDAAEWWELNEEDTAHLHELME